MKRSEAYAILDRMWEDATAEQAEALSIAQNDIEFVDLMPDDMVHVVRCKDCIFREEPKMYGRTIIGELSCRILGVPMNLGDFCCYGERKVGDG